MVFESGDQRLVLRPYPVQVLPMMGLGRERIKAPVERFDEAAK